MEYIVRNISIPLLEITQTNELSLVKTRAARLMGVMERDIQGLKIVKESLDARKKNAMAMVYSVWVSLPGTLKNHKDIVPYVPQPALIPETGEPLTRPVVVGAGPCGLFCAYELVQRGFSPIVVERGEPVEKRSESVKAFWSEGILNPESNVQFGEGGAGTFSDGKLTTRINDPRCSRILEVLCECGASPDIMVRAKPHVGTDVLRGVVKNLRERLKQKGADFLFSTRMESLLIKDGQVQGIRLSDGREIHASAVILAIGHSARDTFQKLFEQGVHLQQKPFSVGVRIEHLQEWMNEAQYGPVRHFKLGPAEYQLYEHMGNRTAYSFCMCPGGIVVAAASEERTIVTNGMSYHARNGINANSAYVVSVGPNDFGSEHPLAGVAFQRRLEQGCYSHTGGYRAPVQRLGDFLNDRPSKGPGVVKPTYTGEIVYTSLKELLPDFVVKGIKQSVSVFGRKLKGFDADDALLTAVETRTSSPVRIMRDDKCKSIAVKGLYPAGEGAGYAGGIVSAAVDGIRVAEQVALAYSK